MKTMKNLAVWMLGLCLCASAAISGSVWAEDGPPMDKPKAEKIAQRAIDAASALADLLDVAKADLGPEPGMPEALAHARELAPKPLEGMGVWTAGPSGSVRAEVSEPMLCRALADMCSGAPSSSPMICGCRPSSGGMFEFGMHIDVSAIGENTSK